MEEGVFECNAADLPLTLHTRDCSKWNFGTLWMTERENLKPITSLP